MGAGFRVIKGEKTGYAFSDDLDMRGGVNLIVITPGWGVALVSFVTQRIHRIGRSGLY
jgi:hypothetical protein